VSVKETKMRMKTIALILTVLMTSALTATAQSARDKDTGPKRVGGVRFIAYEGKQDWPTADTTEVIKDFDVPIYFGLPNKKYKVLGRLYDSRTRGLGVVGRAFDEGLGSEKRRQRNCARLTRQLQADAVLVTADERIIKAFNLTAGEIEDTAPLFHHKDKIVLVIKFQ
jgi:hypothetical protein